MNNTVLPICPFGNVMWWNLLLTEDCVLSDSENFQKQTWRNRYDVLGANGKLTLSIPVQRISGVKAETRTIELHTDQHWKKIHWRSIKSAYGSSPFWIYYSEQLKELFEKEYSSLFEFSINSIQFILCELEIEKKLKFDSESEQEFIPPMNFKPGKLTFKNSPYLQVFEDRFSFTENLSVLDVLFNLGPECESYLKNQNLEL